MNKKSLFIASLFFLLLGCQSQDVYLTITSSSGHVRDPSSFSSQEENVSSLSSMEDESDNNSSILLEDELTMTITANDSSFLATLADNEAARQLKNMLPVTIEMSAMAHEKYYYFDESFPTDTYFPGQIEIGDIMLYGSRCLVIFYESFSTSYTYTRLGKIDDTTGLASALGSSGVTVNLS